MQSTIPYEIHCLFGSACLRPKPGLARPKKYYTIAATQRTIDKWLISIAEHRYITFFIMSSITKLIVRYRPETSLLIYKGLATKGPESQSWQPIQSTTRP